MSFFQAHPQSPTVAAHTLSTTMSAAVPVCPFLEHVREPVRTGRPRRLASVRSTRPSVQPVSIPYPLISEGNATLVTVLPTWSDRLTRCYRYRSLPIAYEANVTPEVTLGRWKAKFKERITLLGIDDGRIPLLVLSSATSISRRSQQAHAS